MIAAYPRYCDCRSFPSDAEDMERVIGSIRAIRTRRAEMNVPPSRRAKLFVVTRYPETYRAAYPFFEKLASASALEVVEGYAADDAVSIVTDAATVYIPMAEMLDLDKERTRLAAEIKKTEGEIARLSGKLANEGFLAKAPAAVVEGEKAKLLKYEDTLAALKTALEKLG
jgi:valyl-tRNA synthetase